MRKALPNIKLVLGYLSFITDKNKTRRLEDFKKSVSSLSKLNNFGKHGKKFVSVDNASCKDAHEELDKFLWDAKFHYSKNFYDIALFYTTLWYAEICQAPYIAWLYDDFILFNDALDDCIDFLDLNQDVSCVRLPIYDFCDKQKYDKSFTQTRTNPDAIRHYNMCDNSQLSWEGPFVIGNNEFYTNNWHYTSRPTLFRTDFFKEIASKQQFKDKQDISHVLQGFEDWAMKEFHTANLKTGVLQGGMARTTPIEHSARLLAMNVAQEMAATLDLKTLRKEFDIIVRELK